MFDGYWKVVDYQRQHDGGSTATRRKSVSSSFLNTEGWKTSQFFIATLGKSERID